MAASNYQPACIRCKACKLDKVNGVVRCTEWRRKLARLENFNSLRLVSCEYFDSIYNGIKR